jgi:hypothetical protein
MLVVTMILTCFSSVQGTSCLVFCHLHLVVSVLHAFSGSPEGPWNHSFRLEQLVRHFKDVHLQLTVESAS